MPVFNLKCGGCGTTKRVLRPQGWSSTQEEVPCPRCRGHMGRDPQGANQGALVKEVIDNGVMPKAVERLADAERLHRDRVEIEDALAKGKSPGRVIR